MSKFYFSRDTMSCAGRTFPAVYVVEGSGAVVVYATIPGQDAPQAIRFDPSSEYHAAALAAATGESAETVKTETATAPEVETIQGDGWRILFDKEAQRTRVFVEEGAPDSIREAVQAAGFWYSPNMGSYNKKLTQKARRAALALAESLKAIRAA